ncbi:MAG: twin-arginine translocase TatA/TatE family subunit [Planctomycetaceae bacterium]
MILGIFGLGGAELAVLAVIVVVLFGNRLPGAAKSLGQSFSMFKKGLKEGAEEDENGVDRLENRDRE